MRDLVNRLLPGRRAPKVDADWLLRLRGEPMETRWKAAGFGGPPPSDQWKTFDRTPWRHPWLNEENLAAFRAFSDNIMHSIKGGPGAPVEKIDVGLVGNMANINYTRAAPMRRNGLRAPVYVHPHDRYLFGQPEWEEYFNSLEFGHDLTVWPKDLPSVADI